MKAVSSKSVPPVRFGTDRYRAVNDNEFTFANLDHIVQAYADFQAAARISVRSAKKYCPNLYSLL